MSCVQLGIKVWKKSTLTALNLGYILNIKDDTNSVLWEENITSFLFIKGYSKFTNNRRHCPTYGYLVSLIFPRFVHELLCVVWKLVCERQQKSADL